MMTDYPPTIDYDSRYYGFSPGYVGIAIKIAVFWVVGVFVVVVLMS